MERSRDPSREPGAKKIKFKKLGQRLTLGAVVLSSSVGYSERQSTPQEDQLSNVAQNLQELTKTISGTTFDLKNSLSKVEQFAHEDDPHTNENSNLAEDLSSANFKSSEDKSSMGVPSKENKDELNSNIRNWMIEGGWPDELLERAEKVVFCESKNDPQVVNKTNHKYHGLFQIEKNWFIYFGEDWESRYDPVVNARVAYKIYLYDREKGNPPWHQWDCKPR